MWLNNKTKPQGLLPGREMLGPLAIIVGTNIMTLTMVYANTVAKGSLSAAMSALYAAPVQFLFTDAWVWPTLPALRVLLTFWAIQLVLMRVVRGGTYYGPVTPAGNRPIYNANGMQCFLITVLGFLLGSHLGWWELDVFYVHYAQIICAITLIAPLFCVFLYFKGILAPSSSDSGTSGNLLLDFYWGTELYPRVFGWDVKQFTNCRSGMMLWALIPISCAAAQAKAAGGVLAPAMAVNVALQLVYVAKFFWWETGYFSSMDIMHDRAGYYICWGCLVWIPTFYVSHSVFLVHHAASYELTLPAAIAIFIAGWLCIYVNYDVDRHRVLARETRGNCLIWGRKPDMIEATYTTEAGEKKTSLLLASGWWGVARHFHYVPEIAASFFWAVPVAGHFDYLMPFAYTLFLIPLLVDRAFRDEVRCASKYGDAYAEYTKRVPYRIIPYIL